MSEILLSNGFMPIMPVVVAQLVTIVLVLVLFVKNVVKILHKKTWDNNAVMSDVRRMNQLGIIACIIAIGWQLYDLGWAGYRGINNFDGCQDVRVVIALIRAIMFSYRIVLVAFVVMCCAFFLSSCVKFLYKRAAS